jgi:hypothetical protein
VKNHHQNDATVYQVCNPISNDILPIIGGIGVGTFYIDNITATKNVKGEKYPLIFVNKDKYYISNPIYLGKIDNVVLTQRPKNKINRTYGWDCPFQDYTSNRHYNTQRHIYLIHGIDSGEPVDHITGETREQKRRVANKSHNQSMNMSAYYRTRPVSPPVRNPGNYCDTTLSAPKPIMMPFLEAQERRIKELGYTVPAQPAHNYGQHPVGTASWANAPHYRNISATNRIENVINYYSSNTNQLYNLPSSAYPTIPPGPLKDLIDILFCHESFLRCLR